MSNMLKAFSSTLSVFKKDRVILILSFIPIVLGIILYSFFGNWILSDVLTKLKSWIEGYLSGDLGSILYYIIFFTFSLIFIFLINWTFVLIVSIISSPFNDIISERVERYVGSKRTDDSNDVKKILKNFFKNIFNEIKKVTFIFSLTLIIFLLDILVPFLAPIGIFLSALLMSSTFLDYSWSRNEFPLRKCIVDLKGSLLIYGISGLFFMGLLALPIINLFALPFGVVYYTLLFCEGPLKES